MKLSSFFGCSFSCVALLFSSSSLPGALTPNQIQQSAQGENTAVIVILRDQLPSVPSPRGAHQARASALATAQMPILSELQQAGARNIHSFALVNAVAATISRAEIANLAAHPLVQAVVPDVSIKLPRHKRRVGGMPGADHASIAAASETSAASGLCDTLEPQALQLTNTAFLDPSIPQAQLVLDGNGVPVTGKGVRVAYIADGLDPTIEGFVRPDGTSVFIDYQDFSGFPAGTPVGGIEAFGDASSIAAQDMPNGTPLTFDISQFVNPAHPLPSPCNIRIRGMAPGASLVGLVMGATSNLVQAIEWAVIHDDVDVINESFGDNFFPDNLNDPITLANDAAVRAGVTVVVASGDQGPAGTLESPATDPNVIAVGASTQFRIYAQTKLGAQPLAQGYLNNNIAAFSSGGASENGARTVDVVAPGDAAWALCSTDQAIYNTCFGSLVYLDNNLDSPPSPIQEFAGTSESAPLTAGEAALVIQAYRSTHHGANPTPALVKQIIMSTATDLGAPAYQQGAGLINSLAAVQLALSVHDTNGTPPAQGNGLLISPTSGSAIGMPNSSESLTFTITNGGSTTQHLAPVLQRLGPPIAGAKLNLDLNLLTAPTFLDSLGTVNSYVKQTFNVPAGADHLDAAIAWQNPVNGPPVGAFISLLDPAGRQAAFSFGLLVGYPGYAHVDVVKPTAGMWTAVIFAPSEAPFPSLVVTGPGPLKFSWTAERYVTLGSVSPARFDLAPGAHQTIKASFDLPQDAGDAGAAIRLNQTGNSGATMPEIPVSLRTVIPLGPNGGDFTGTLTGGTGEFPSAKNTYDFAVPQGVDNLSLGLAFSDDGYLLDGLLIDPNGMQLSVQDNHDPDGNTQRALQLFRANPQPGNWRFILIQDYFASGKQTSLPFSGHIRFNAAQVSAPNLPNHPNIKLSARGGPVKIAIHVTNTGAVTESYFADARLNGSTSLALQKYQCFQWDYTFPGENCALFFVPTQVTSIQFLTQSSLPIAMDVFSDPILTTEEGFANSIDIEAKPVANGAVAASLTMPEVPFAAWIVNPTAIGPFGPTGAPPVQTDTTAIAVMQPFDTAVSADSGDAWIDLALNTDTYNPLVLSPGKRGVINLTITPDPTQVGKTINGFVYIDTFNSFLANGDEVVRIPYRYTIAP